MMVDSVNDDGILDIREQHPTIPLIDPIDRRADHQLAIPLDSAIANGQMWLAYQPQIRISDGKLVGVEALLRWDHPSLGFIRPDAFIPVAESTGAITQLGIWVISEACRGLCSWLDAHPGQDLTVSLNLSVTQLNAPSLLAVLTQETIASDLDPSQINIELTESLPINSPTSIKLLHHIVSLGYGLSLDDFCTGRSNLDALLYVPATCIKIDRGFISAMERSRTARVLVKNLINTAIDLGIDIIAEGIQTQSQAAYLYQLGVEVGQGSLWSMPIRLAQVEDSIRQPEQLSRTIS